MKATNIFCVCVLISVGGWRRRTGSPLPAGRLLLQGSTEQVVGPAAKRSMRNVAKGGGQAAILTTFVGKSRLVFKVTCAFVAQHQQL